MKEIKELIEKFVNSQAYYGEITELNIDATAVHQFIQDYILKEHLSICILRVKNKIFLSRNNLEFDRLYEMIKGYCRLLTSNKLLEIWEDKENKFLNVVFPSIKRHFLVRYVDERDKLGNIEAILHKHSSFF